jgi:adenylate cyclase
MEYTVIGRTVNVASRLEQLNKELSTDILVSEDTFSRVEGLVEAERQEPHTVRGVSAPVTTYRVIGLKQEHGV